MARSKLEQMAKEQGKTVVALLAETYAQCGGDRKAVAEALGVSSSTVGYQLLVNGLEERVVLVQSNTGYQITKSGKLALEREQNRAVMR